MIEDRANNAKLLLETAQNTREKLSNLGFSQLGLDTAWFAFLGGRRLLQHRKFGIDISPELKIEDDTIVTRTDKHSAHTIKRHIQSIYPDDDIAAEDISGHETNTQKRWVFDPLDGTSIYASGLEGSTTTVLVEEKREELPLTAAICDPFGRRLLLGERKVGVYLISQDFEGQLNIKHIVIPKPTRRLTMFIDTTLRKTTIPKTLFLASLPRVANINVNVIATGSNVNNQMQSIIYGHAWLTDAIGGQWDVKTGSFLTNLAGGKSTALDGMPVSSTTKSVVVGACDEAIYEIVCKTASIAYAGYKNYKEG